MNDVLIRAKLIFHGEDGEDREDAVHSAEEQKSANQYQKRPIVYNVSKALPKIFDNKRKARLANAGFPFGVRACSGNPQASSSPEIKKLTPSTMIAPSMPMK